jgi:hypothetical protein
MPPSAVKTAASVGKAAVAGHRARRIEDDLAAPIVGAADARVDQDPDAGERLAHRPEARLADGVYRGDRAALRLPVDLDEVDAEALEELGDVLAHRGRAAEGESDLAAELGADLREDHALREAADDALALAERGAAVPLPLRLDAGGEDPAHGGGLRGHRLVDLVVKLVPDARHADDRVRVRGRDRRGNALEGRRDGDGRAVRDREEELEETADVRPREDRDGALARRRRPHCTHAGDGARNRPVGEHDALRLAGRPRRVDDRRGLVGAHVARLERRGRLDEMGERRVVAAAALDVDHVRERREIGEHPADLGVDGGRGAEADLRAAVLQDEGPVLLELLLVHRNDGATEAEGSRHDRHPLGAVPRDEGDRVPTLETEAHERAAEARRVAPEVAVRRVRPRGAGRALRSEEVPAAMGRDRLVEDRRERSGLGHRWA